MMIRIKPWIKAEAAPLQYNCLDLAPNVILLPVDRIPKADDFATVHNLPLPPLWEKGAKGVYVCPPNILNAVYGVIFQWSFHHSRLLLPLNQNR